MAGESRYTPPPIAQFLSSHAAAGTKPVRCPDCSSVLEGAHDGVYYVRGFVYNVGEFAPDDPCLGCR